MTPGTGKPIVKKEYYTTGEVAELLNISRSTVARGFDKAIFEGKKNPITGERLINRESLILFMNKYGYAQSILASERKRILAATADEALFSLIQKTFADNEHIQVERVLFGTDALVACSKEKPDLLILDEELSDVYYVEVIKALRRTNLRSDLKILCCHKTESSDQCSCMEWGANESFSKDILDESNLANKVYALLEIGRSKMRSGKALRRKRRWPRVNLHLPVDLEVFSIEPSSYEDLGSAMLENISFGGAYLSQIQLSKRMIPGTPFRIRLKLDASPLKNWQAECRSIRFRSNGDLSAGVEFTQISKPDRDKIKALFKVLPDQHTSA